MGGEERRREEEEEVGTRGSVIENEDPTTQVGWEKEKTEKKKKKLPCDVPNPHEASGKRSRPTLAGTTTV